MTENNLLIERHILLCIGDYSDNINIAYIKEHFCGKVFTDLDSYSRNENLDRNGFVYICGDIAIVNQSLSLIKERTIIVIKDLSWNYETLNDIVKLIEMGEVPIKYHNIGVYFRKLFSSNESFFENISREHHFQALTESNKPSNAFRKGIYLTNVKQDEDKDEIRFNLLRCSSNLNGPSDNFRESDVKIVRRVNDISSNFFRDEVELNHVLAQIYENTLQITSRAKEVEKKAKIKAHSDKTKDMPRNGLIAFCTFYKFDPTIQYQRSVDDNFDIHYKKTSVLTKLQFRLKSTVTDPFFVKEFTVTLYPNSVFIIPLSTNRLYTHEIKPSILPIDKIPIRMGYVIRCSKTEAIYKNGETFIYEEGKRIKMEAITNDDIVHLRQLYFRENVTDDLIDYGSINFSMNNGDHLKPLV